MQATTPYQNEVAKRKNCSLVERANSMVLGNKLPPGLWVKAINCVAYLLNCNPTKG
jgi:hypothetical protein